MATPPFSIAETVPADDDEASQFPALERTFRDVVESWLLTEHTTMGIHDKITMADRATPTPGAEQLALWSASPGKLMTRYAAGPARAVAVIDVGTRMLFDEDVVPTGWTLATDVHDRVLRVVNSTGGANSGSWVLSGLTIETHVLTVEEIPAHTHTYTTRAALQDGTFTSGPGNTAAETQTSSSTGGGQGHSHGITHDGTWRPASRDVIVGIKD